jgi:hypothetical protein
MIGKDKLVTVKEGEPAVNVLLLMNRNKIGRVFVLDDSGGKLSGIITRSDVMKTIEMEEAIQGGKGNSALRQMILVDTGMLFEIEVPVNTGEEWTASYDQNVFSLMSDRILQLTDGGQSKQFTFQALQKGKFLINLNRTVSQDQAPAQSKMMGRSQTIGHTITVN